MWPRLGWLASGNLSRRDRSPHLAARLLAISLPLPGQQLRHRIPLRLVKRQLIGPMAPRDHQAVARGHGVGIGDAHRPLPSGSQNTQPPSRIP